MVVVFRLFLKKYREGSDLNGTMYCLSTCFVTDRCFKYRTGIFNDNIKKQKPLTNLTNYSLMFGCCILAFTIVALNVYNESFKVEYEIRLLLPDA